MTDTAWHPHPPYEQELPPGYSWRSYPDTALVRLAQDDWPVLFPLPVADISLGRFGPIERGPEPLPLPPDVDCLRLCLVLGTPGAGKTSLVAAWVRAGASAGPESGALRVEQRDGFQAWDDGADAAFAQPGHPESGRARSGAVGVVPARGEPEHWTFHEPAAAACFRERPGSRIDTSEELPGLPSAPPGRGWNSVSLVLCIDGERPQRELWQRSLPRHIEAWTAAAQANASGEPPTGAGLFDRVLVLLTKLDRFCASARGAAHRSRSRSQKLIAALRPEDLARRLDPTHQVRAVLGDGTLELLLDSLKPGGVAAAALVSTFGFDATLAGTAGAFPPWRSTTWRPFGVQETLLYLAGGPATFPVARADRATVRHELVTLAE